MENENTIIIPEGTDIKTLEKGSAEYNQAMINFADHGTYHTPKTTDTKTEELIAGKFKNQDELLKAYEELQKKLGDNKQENNTDVKPEDNKTENNTETKADVISKLNDGTITAEEAKAFGLSDEVIKAINAGKEAIKSQNKSKLLEGIDGGEQKYNEMLTWAHDNYNESEKQVFNSMLNSNDVNVQKFAVESLKARFSADNNEPNVIVGRGKTDTSTGSYQSEAQMLADMKDPRYKNDPAFRAMVMDKLAKSKLV